MKHCLITTEANVNKECSCKGSKIHGKYLLPRVQSVTLSNRKEHYHMGRETVYSGTQFTDFWKEHKVSTFSLEYYALLHYGGRFHWNIGEFLPKCSATPHKNVNAMTAPHFAQAHEVQKHVLELRTFFWIKQRSDVRIFWTFNQQVCFSVFSRAL
jgi:hypothetical protein